MLQIEMLPNRVCPLSRSVTSGTNFAELLLQIETFWDRGRAIAVKTTTKVPVPIVVV